MLVPVSVVWRSTYFRQNRFSCHLHSRLHCHILKVRQDEKHTRRYPTLGPKENPLPPAPILIRVVIHKHHRSIAGRTNFRAARSIAVHSKMQVLACLVKIASPPKVPANLEIPPVRPRNPKPPMRCIHHLLTMLWIDKRIDLRIVEELWTLQAPPMALSLQINRTRRLSRELWKEPSDRLWRTRECLGIHAVYPMVWSVWETAPVLRVHVWIVLANILEYFFCYIGVRGNLAVIQVNVIKVLQN